MKVVLFASVCFEALGIRAKIPLPDGRQRYNIPLEYLSEKMLRACALVALIGTDLKQSSARRPNVRRSDEMFTYAMADRPAMLQQVDGSHGILGIGLIRIESEHMSRACVVAANLQKC